jgi:hypothetical protein
MFTGARLRMHCERWRENGMAASGDQLPPPRRSLRMRLRRSIEALGPYQSLVLLLIPTSLVEPLKLIAVAIAGHGHWITGTAMIIGAYLASLLLVERLFRIVKPKLLMLGWFAHLWSYVVIARSKAIAIFRKP